MFARLVSRGPAPLPLNGLGNKEFNERHTDWDGYDYAYEILSVYDLKTPLLLMDLKKNYGWKTAPRGLVYVTSKMLDECALKDQIIVHSKISRLPN